MTIYSHTVTMNQVRIAELEARLSEYLRAVRGGDTIAGWRERRRSAGRQKGQKGQKVEKTR